MGLFDALLGNLKQKLSQEAETKTALSAILSTTLGLTVSPEMLSIKETTLYVQGSPTIKMAINLHQERILEALKVGKFSITRVI